MPSHPHSGITEDPPDELSGTSEERLGRLGVRMHFDDVPRPERNQATSPPTARPDLQASVFFFLLLAASIGILGYLLWPFIHDFILACVMAGLLTPVYRRLLVSLGGRRNAAALACILLVVGIVAIPVGVMVVQLAAEVQTLYLAVADDLSYKAVRRFLFGKGWLASNARALAARLGVPYDPQTFQSYVSDLISTWGGLLYDRVNLLITNLLSVLFHFGLTLLIAFYLLQEAATLKPWIMRLTPLPDDEDARLASQFMATSRAIVYGNGIGSLIQGVLGWGILSFTGVPSAILWATVMGICSSLPVIGVAIVSVPASIYLIYNENYGMAILLYGFCSIMNLMVENVVKTILIGSQVHIHSLMIFLSVLGGIWIFGVLGLLYGPLIVALAMTVLDLYDVRYRSAGQPPGGLP